jgi:hypothetical protein
MKNLLKDPFLLAAGGLGDLLVSLACVDDMHEKIDVVFFADDPTLIKQAKFLPIINQLLVFDKKQSIHKWNEFLNLENCISTGITPKQFDYSEWKDCNVFEKYKITEFPNFINSLNRNRVAEKQSIIMLESSNSNTSKHKIILEKNISIIAKELEDYKDDIFLIGNSLPNYELPKNWDTATLSDSLSLESKFELIRGSDIVYSVDSWVKTVSAMSGIKTIVYDNVYSNNYEENMGGQDWGHNIFLNNWQYIELRSQK